MLTIGDDYCEVTILKMCPTQLSILRWLPFLLSFDSGDPHTPAGGVSILVGKRVKTLSRAAAIRTPNGTAVRNYKLIANHDKSREKRPIKTAKIKTCGMGFAIDMHY